MPTARDWRMALLAGLMVFAGGGLRPVAAQAPAPLTIAGEVTRPLTLTIEALKAMPRTTLTAAEGGGQVRYEGVLLAELLKQAGAPLGTPMGRGASGMYVLATASDGYQVVLSLGEIDPALGAGQILVADAANGAPLAASQGPLRLVVATDKGGARSARMLQRLTVVRAEAR